MELRPDFEAPYITLAELFLQQGNPAAASSVATEGIRSTHDADGRLHFLRAAASVEIGGRTDEVLRDLDVALGRAARPGPVYLLRAAVRTQVLDDELGALSDLESFAEWSDAAGVAGLRTDRRFAELHGNPRFEDIVTRYGE
jgi:hypothetical protein